MNRRRMGALFVVGFLTLAFAVAACGRRSEERRGGNIPADLDTLAFAPESVQVRADVDSGNAQLIRAAMTGSGDLFANVFTEDGVIVHPGGPAIQGRDSITAIMGRAFSKSRLERGTITTMGLRISGDSAHEVGRFRLVIVPVKGGRARADSGQFLKIWKYTGGQWKVARAATSGSA